MKMTRYSEPQIPAILRQAEGGVPVSELCREHGMSNASFYKWRSKYGGMDASMISQMKALEDENQRLKKMYAEKILLPHPLSFGGDCPNGLWFCFVRPVIPLVERGLARF